MLVTIAFSVIGVLGDYFLKLASGREQPLRTSWFYLGFALYASTAFGWVFVMKYLKLATISVLYSVSLVLLLTAIHSAAQIYLATLGVHYWPRLLRTTVTVFKRPSSPIVTRTTVKPCQSRSRASRG